MQYCPDSNKICREGKYMDHIRLMPIILGILIFVNIYLIFVSISLRKELLEKRSANYDNGDNESNDEVEVVHSKACLSQVIRIDNFHRLYSVSYYGKRRSTSSILATKYCC